MATSCIVLFVIGIFPLISLAVEVDLDKAAGVVNDYKIHVDAGKEDCYYQFVDPGASLYVSFQVLKGGDGMAGFAIKHPNGRHVHPYQWKPESDYEEQKSVGGLYEICLDNQFSRFAAKLINLYISSFSMENWQKFSDELGKDFELARENVKNLTDALSKVDNNIKAMEKFQQYTRKHEARDMALVQSNYAYVARWSILQVVVILVVSLIQVYFVRKFFDTPKARPRA